MTAPGSSKASRSAAPPTSPSSTSAMATTAAKASSKPSSSKSAALKPLLPKPTVPIMTNLHFSPAASKRKAATAPAIMARAGKKARQDPAPSKSETTSHPKKPDGLCSENKKLRNDVLDKAVEIRDLKNRLEAMEESSKANDAKMQKELLMKTIEAAGLEADNQRLRETGSFKQRMELAKKTVEIEQKTAQIKDLEETEGALRKRIKELEALQKMEWAKKT
ncbi:hypothetical protein VMCG_04201 [Cytospora schulzeri]|uniref:Uncharacterized protein n=1 Tax=Cytospora schulzeri TaxID=448051 RepID=A0A423WTW5_9PEZI|nr:hypothetical protein VMCG_04201 [Valsa malicola]